MRISDWSSDVCSSDLALDVRRVEREHTLHTLAEGNLAHGEAGTETLVRTRDAHAFVVLDTGAFAFHDPHADAQRVAGAELGNLLRLVELGDRKSTRLNASH